MGGCDGLVGFVSSRHFFLNFLFLMSDVVPIGRSLSDGLAYPVNPRFHPDGRWRRREEWPEELR